MTSVAYSEMLAVDQESVRRQESERTSVMSDIISGRIPAREVAEIPLRYLDVSKLSAIDVPEHNVMTPSTTYKPFRYEFGYKMWERQNQLHWLPETVPLNKDIRDWTQKLSKAEKNLVTHIFPLFVQNDFLVGNVYVHQYCKIFKPNELQLGFTAIANMESTHQVAYAHLLNELGFSEDHYSAFLEYVEMADKYNFTAGFRMDTLLGIAVAMVVFGALTEGVQLFASFAVMFNFSRSNKLTGMGQIVSWSVRDESLHVSFVARLYMTFMHEFGHLIDMDRLEAAVDSAVDQIVKNEHRFSDLAFEFGPVEGLEVQNVKDYISNIADFRLTQFGFKKKYNTAIGPIGTWIDSMMGGIEHVNFFEQRGTDYSKAATRGSWDTAFDVTPKPDNVFV